MKAMVEMFGIYALLLAAWGLYSERRAAAHGDEAAHGEEASTAAALSAAPATPAIAATTRERGAAARSHLRSTA